MTAIVGGGGCLKNSIELSSGKLILNPDGGKRVGSGGKGFKETINLYLFIKCFLRKF